MYADVIVLTYQSPDINHFTYLVPQYLEKQIKVGQLVEVPFGNRAPMGIVISLRNHPYESEDRILDQVENDTKRDSFANAQNDRSKNQNDKRVVIKPILSVILPHPILLPYQVELVKWMSFYYLAPMVNCLEAMLPFITQQAKRSSAKARPLPELNLKLRPGLSQAGQTLVLVPTINHIPQTLAQFPKAKNYALYHNELKPTEKFATWLKILSGGVDYVFGSRSAIFTPCPKLSEIIIFNEHEHAYKDERSPYYDTLTVAQKISQLTEAKIQIIDSSPKISTYFSLIRHSGEQRDARMTIDLSGRHQKVKTHIVSMQQERQMQNFGPISDLLLSLLKKNVHEGKNSLLFLNKKKESGALFCKSCKSHVYLQQQPETCPNCGSQDFYFNILNTNSLAREVQKQIPAAKINLISENSRLSTIDYRLSNIHIATSSIFYAPQILKYDLLAHIAPDTLLQRADFASGEILYEQITSLKALLKKDGVLILQTYDPDNLIIKYAASGDYPSHYNEQLKLRRALSYPPFALLVKLTVKSKDKQKLQQKAEGLISNLRLTMNDERLAILGPYEPVFFSKNAIYNIIIKYKLGGYSLDEREKAIKSLQSLRSLKDVQITVEPESIN